MQGLSMVVCRWSMQGLSLVGGSGSDPDARDKGAGVSIFHIDDLLSCRVCHLPAVTGFGGVIAGVIIGVTESL